MMTTGRQGTAFATWAVNRIPGGRTRGRGVRAWLAMLGVLAAVSWTAPGLVAGPESKDEEPNAYLEDVNVRAADGITTYWAIICGVADYPGTRNDLDYAADDAVLIYNALLADPRWNSSRIWILKDGQVTRNGVYQAIQSVAARADADDICLFSFSGHGMTGFDVYPYDEYDGLDEYIVPNDGILYQASTDSEFILLNQCIRDDDLATWLRSLPVWRYVVILDTCFSGGAFKALEKTRGIGDLRPELYDSFAPDVSVGVTLKDLNDSQRAIVITACDDDELSAESGALGSGILTYFVVEALRGAADANWDGNVSAQECYSYVQKHMGIWTENQHPQLYDESDSTVNLTSVCGDFDVTIAGSRYMWTYPMRTYFHDSRTQAIYLAEEVGRPGAITALTLHVVVPPKQPLNNWTIRMKHTASAANTSNAFDADGWTVVYRSHEPMGEAGWRTFTLQTPFAYNGVDNLLVDFSHNNDSYSDDGACGYFSADTTRTIVACSDSKKGDPTAWSGTMSPTVQGSNGAPSVRLTLRRTY